MTAMTTPAEPQRRFRFGPLDRAGVILGLTGTQCSLLAAGMLTAGAALQARASVLVAITPVVLAAGATFGRWHARPLPDWLGPLTGWAHLHLSGGSRWHARPRHRVHPGRPHLPPFLTGVTLTELAADGGARPAGVGAIETRRSVSATLRVRGREFALLEPSDQARVLDAWGSALGAFCRERSPVTRISWCEWSAPASLDEHLAFVRTHTPNPTPTPDSNDVLNAGDGLLDAYEAMVRDAGPLTTTHDVLVTVTIDRSRIDRRAAHPGDDPASRLLLDEVNLFARRLDHAGLDVDGPLSAAELAHLLRIRLDPTSATRLSRRAQTLGEAAGVVSAHNWAPFAVRTHWHEVQVDGAWHRGYWIAEWPRLEVPADWMAPLVLHAGSIRTLSLVYEPVAPSRSRRAIDRDATRLASDEDQRSRRGFRIGAAHRRAHDAVLSREAELVAGYPELAYTGFLTVTAATLEALDAASADWEQAAAQVGLELRCLDGQHDLALAATLPIGYAPAPRRTL